MSMRPWAALVLVAVAACSGGSYRSAPTTTTPKTRAEALCRATVPDPEHLWSSDPTTVGVIRQTTIATIGPAQFHSFPSLTSKAFGAWCWTKSGGMYTTYKAANGKAIAVAGQQVSDLAASAAHGPPSIP